LAHALKLHTLHREFFPDERIQIHATRDDIAPGDTSQFSAHAKLAANVIENVRREKSDLPLVIFLEIEKAVTGQPLARHTFDFVHFNRRKIARHVSLVAKKIVARRNENPLNLDVIFGVHHRQTLIAASVKCNHASDKLVRNCGVEP
jgi:hypothetical protein